ncbi:MAG TPA: hypothetical protein PLQ81_12160, partial [bacterium]|nr:hypothetical protein [bacterium]
NLFKINNEYFIAVEELTKSVAGKILNSSSPEEKFEIIKKFKGIQLKNILCSHPFWIEPQK